MKEALRPDTILVAVTAVDSELGVVQPVTEIAALLKDYPHCHLHVDATQAVGKLPLLRLRHRHPEPDRPQILRAERHRCAGQAAGPRAGTAHPWR